MQGFAIYVITHGLSEIVLWYSLGQQYSPTSEKEDVHPSEDVMAMQALSTNKGRQMRLDSLESCYNQWEQEEALKAKPAAALKIKLNNGKATTGEREETPSHGKYDHHPC